MGILRTDTISGLETPTPVTGSVSFDGSGDYLTVTSSDFSFGTGDFTIECWYNLTATPTNFYIFDFGSNGMRFQIYDSGSGPVVYMMTSTSTYVIAPANSYVTVGQWYHIAMTRIGTTVTGFINGISQGTQTVADNFTHTALTIGNYGGGGDYEFTGYLSNLRILKGTALYTSNFTPPTRELQPIGDTVLLCCNNPDSAGAEATGKTITVNGDAVASTFSPGLTRDFTYGTQFDGVSRFDTQGYFVPPSGTTEQRSRGRGLFGGGSSNIIEYITIASTGNAVDFGDTSTSISNGSSLGSSTRGVIGGYSTPTTVNTIEYITFATTSNTLDFGDLTVARWGTSSTSSTTRGIFYSGYVAPANVNVIDYITIASIGNATDFGDATTAGRNGDGCGSPVRGIFASGISPSTNVIEYLTISSTGNSIDFGDLTVGRFASAASSSTTRAVFSGGYVGPAGQLTNTIDYITISSTGNAQDFGDLTRANWSLKGLSNSIRGIIGGGYVAPVYNNNIDYLTISSTGNSQDFGDMTSSRGGYSACSDSHGGLG
jgi:hypothetical protein